MTAWIKPDSLDGERFIFGQTSQGIHNGIRNNAFLHQAHWGADTVGNTNPYSWFITLSSASNYPAGDHQPMPLTAMEELSTKLRKN